MSQDQKIRDARDFVFSKIDNMRNANGKQIDRKEAEKMKNELVQRQIQREEKK